MSPPASPSAEGPSFLVSPSHSHQKLSSPASPSSTTIHVHLTSPANLQAEYEQGLIDNHVHCMNLKAYQERLQRELTRFITCYFLAPAGIFKLEDNAADTAISLIGHAPGGVLFQVFSPLLSYANKKHRLYQINHLSELFLDPQHITDVCWAFSRRLTLVRQADIQKKAVEPHKGMAKEILEAVKQKLIQVYEGLSVADKTGVSLQPEEKLAIMDGAFLLQKILSGEYQINKKADLDVQFVRVLCGEDYQPPTYVLAQSELLSPPHAALQSFSQSVLTFSSSAASLSSYAQDVEANVKHVAALNLTLEEGKEDPQAQGNGLSLATAPSPPAW